MPWPGLSWNSGLEPAGTFLLLPQDPGPEPAETFLHRKPDSGPAYSGSALFLLHPGFCLTRKRFPVPDCSGALIRRTPHPKPFRLRMFHFAPERSAASTQGMPHPAPERFAVWTHQMPHPKRPEVWTHRTLSDLGESGSSPRRMPALCPGQSGFWLILLGLGTPEALPLPDSEPPVSGQTRRRRKPKSWQRPELCRELLPALAGLLIWLVSAENFGDDKRQRFFS